MSDSEPQVARCAKDEFNILYSSFGQRTDSTNAFVGKSTRFWYFVRDGFFCADFFPLRADVFDRCPTSV